MAGHTQLVQKCGVLVRNFYRVFFAAALVQVLEYRYRLGRCHVILESLLDNPFGFYRRVLGTKQRLGREPRSLLVRHEGRPDRADDLLVMFAALF